MAEIKVKNTEKESIKNTKQLGEANRDNNNQLDDQVAKMLKLNLQQQDILVSTTKFNQLLKEVEKTLTNISDKQKKVLTLKEGEKVVTETILKFKRQQLGLTKEDFDLLQKQKENQNQYQKLFSEHLETSKELTDVLSSIPGMGILIRDAQKFGMATMKGVDFVHNLTSGINLSTVSMKAFVASTGVGLAVMALLSAGTFTFQNMLKFNVGNLSAIFGSTMAYIGNKWAIFEVKVASALQVLGPMFQDIFGGVANVIKTLVDVALDFGEVFFNTIADVMGPMNELLGAGDSAGGIFDYIATVIKSFTPILKGIAFITAIGITNFMILANVVGKVFDIFNDIWNIIKDIFSLGMPDWLTKFMGWNSSDESAMNLYEKGIPSPQAEALLQKEKEAMPLASSTSNTTATNISAPQTFNLTLTNATPETVDYAVASLKTNIPNAEKASHMMGY